MDEPTWKKRGCGTSLLLAFWTVLAVVVWCGLLFLAGQAAP